MPSWHVYSKFIMRIWSGLGGKGHGENRAGEDGGGAGHTMKGTFENSLEGSECAARLISCGGMQASRGDSGVKEGGLGFWEEETEQVRGKE